MSGCRSRITGPESDATIAAKLNLLDEHLFVDEVVGRVAPVRANPDRERDVSASLLGTLLPCVSSVTNVT
jgi:hypothetical protein